MRDRWVDRWKGRTVVSIASGPSLTLEDCEKVRASGLPVIVTNTTYQRCPWADVVFGFDGAWWREYRKQVAAGVWPPFPGDKVTCSAAGAAFGADSLLYQQWFRPYGISGASSVSLAIAAGARTVLLLGHDIQARGSDGAIHWHGDHAAHMSNARSMSAWPRHYKRLATFADQADARILNCSRSTALTCFPRVSLEDALAIARHAQLEAAPC